MSEALRTSVLLSLQRALIGQIAPEMKAVAVRLSPDEVQVVLYVDPDTSDDVIDDFDAGTMTQVVADFAWPERGDPRITLTCVRVGNSDAIPLLREQTFVFARSDVRFAMSS